MEKLKSYWGELAKIAAWLTGLVGVFLIEPPVLSPTGAEDPNLWLRLSQFVVAVVVGLFFLESRQGKLKRRKWRAVALATLVLGLVLFVGYQILMSAWTCPYLGMRAVTGSTLLPDAAQYMETYRGTTCSRLIGTALGATELVWPHRQLIQHYIVICLIYTLAMLSFSAAAMSTVEYVRSRRDETPEPAEDGR